MRSERMAQLRRGDGAPGGKRVHPVSVRLWGRFLAAHGEAPSKKAFVAALDRQDVPRDQATADYRRLSTQKERIP